MGTPQTGAPVGSPTVAATGDGAGSEEGVGASIKTTVGWPTVATGEGGIEGDGEGVVAAMAGVAAVATAGGKAAAGAASQNHWSPTCTTLYVGADAAAPSAAGAAAAAMGATHSA